MVKKLRFVAALLVVMGLAAFQVIVMLDVILMSPTGSSLPVRICYAVSGLAAYYLMQPGYTEYSRRLVAWYRRG